uniref:Apelin receptor early endogenous ligand n=1 Tax=Sinocyclocheilus grahami TaxID=75366 RepID=A0A672S701_SINGR
TAFTHETNFFFTLLNVVLRLSKHSDFLNLRRKYRRHKCPKKRCLPLHSRVPFP